jgi:predicted phage terminase large subunit-like protein
MTAGVDVPIQGWHFDIIVCDDLQGQTNNTPEGIEKVANYLNLLWPVLNPGGELIWVCTRWDFNDVAARILKEWEEGEGHWDALPVARGYLGATAWPGDEEFFQDVDGTCHFDTSLPIDDPKRKVFQSVLDSETCETLKKDPPIGMGIYNYSCQIENDPLPSKAATFDPNDFRYVPDWAPEDAVDPQSPAFDLLAGMTYYLGLDVASGEEEIKYGDDCAIHVLGVRGSGLQRQHFVVESIGGKWKPDETVDRLFTICGKWRPAAVGIETNAMQKTYKWFITKRMNDLGIYLPIRELKRGGRKTKSDEIRKMQPFYRAHSVFHFKSFRNTPLETQLIRFKPGSSIHDDYPDSLAMCFELIREGYQLNTERARERKAKQRQIRIRPRGRHVGWY